MDKRLSDSDWINIFRNTTDNNEEVEVMWLDPGDSSDGEWCLCCDCELFEDGFNTEQEAIDRLHELENRLL